MGCIWSEVMLSFLKWKRRHEQLVNRLADASPEWIGSAADHDFHEFKFGEIGPAGPCLHVPAEIVFAAWWSRAALYHGGLRMRRGAWSPAAGLKDIRLRMRPSWLQLTYPRGSISVSQLLAASQQWAAAGVELPREVRPLVLGLMQLMNTVKVAGSQATCSVFLHKPVSSAELSSDVST